MEYTDFEISEAVLFKLYKTQDFLFHVNIPFSEFHIKLLLKFIFFASVESSPN